MRRSSSAVLLLRIGPTIISNLPNSTLLLKAAPKPFPYIVFSPDQHLSNAVENRAQCAADSYPTHPTLIYIGSYSIDRGQIMDWYLLAWQRYSDFDGRSQRKEYWMFGLFNFLAAMALGALGGFGLLFSRHLGIILFAPAAIYILALFVPGIAVSIRRYHDTGRSGWLLLLFTVLGMIPGVNLISSIVNLVFLCEDSAPGANQYGPNPKLSDPAYAAFAQASPYSSLTPNPQQKPSAGESPLRICKSCGAAQTEASNYCRSCGAPN